jgi:hypothetical protein
VRGQGCVPRSNDADFEYFSVQHGKTVRAYLRMPNTGEAYYYFCPRNWPQFLDADGVFVLERFVRYFGERDLKDKTGIGVRYSENHNIPPNRTVVVFKVDAEL